MSGESQIQLFCPDIFITAHLLVTPDVLFLPSAAWSLESRQMGVADLNADGSQTLAEMGDADLLYNGAVMTKAPASHC